MSELDPNKVTAELVVAATEAALKNVTAPARNVLRRAIQSLTNGYSPFLERTFQRVSTIKTFLKPNEPVDLLTNFVSVTAKIGDDLLDETELIERLQNPGRVVVSALAGRGKSVLMRFIALAYYHSPRGRIPLFLELRALNSLSKKDILGYIHSTYQGTSSIQFSDFVAALNSGFFILILDGFDEVDYDSRFDIEGQILRLAAEYPKCPMIVSGRPDDRFKSWDSFTVYDIAPMSLVQVNTLIDRADYDVDVKKAFKKKLTDEFYQEHKSFLGTPLLAILLMLTFEQYAEIPRSLHTFYHNAFETLVRRHDAMKSQFLRKTYSQCSVDQFRKVFSAFCIYTYSKSEFQFTRDEITAALAVAAQKQGVPADPANLLADFIESICLIQVEGFEYSFVHRSFQEYFSALFIAQSPSGVLDQYLNSGRARTHDNVLPMLFEMAQPRVEAEWVAGFTDSLIQDLEQDKDPPLKLILDAHDTVNFGMIGGSPRIVYFSSKPLARKLAALRRLYPAYFVAVGNGIRPDYPVIDNIETTRYLDELIELASDRKAANDRRFAKFDELAEASKTPTSGPIPSLAVRLQRRDKEMLKKLRFFEYGEGLLRAVYEINHDVKSRQDTDTNFMKEIFFD